MHPRRPPLLASLTGFIARRRAIRAAIRTERIVGSLPRDIRKDIGWPDLWVEINRRADS
jgi:hypothetical protein